jgi:methylase of polypeptide subunit release factors
VGKLILKTLIKQIDPVVEGWLPLPQPLDEAIAAWASLHGWDASTRHGQRLLIRQALLNASIRQTVSTITSDFFATPLDSLHVEAPEPLVKTISEAAQRAQGEFNFWGELYSALIPQSERRRIGQFWTHEQVAEWMVAWLLQSRPRSLIDVGCGAGNFLLKATQLLKSTKAPTQLYGLDLSPLLLNVTRAAFLTRPSDGPRILPQLSVQDFFDSALPPDVDAVVCNPPYTRHHHLAPELKDKLQAFFKTRLHLDVSRQGTLAYYFLLKLITDMSEGAGAAVIVPMEVIDARYGKAAKRVLCQQATLRAIIHFSPQMNAFHKVDVGASILLFRKGREQHNQVCHLTLTALPEPDELLACLEMKSAGQRGLSCGSLVVQPQDELLEIPKWFSITSAASSSADWPANGLVVPLKHVARVVRGIATGANEFFVLPTATVREHQLESYVVRTIHRNREVQDIILDEDRWQTLAHEGRCVWLLYLGDEDVSQNAQLREYLAKGEAKGYHQRSLVQTRKKWYAMERRDVPPIFFTLLTRGNPRFILNRAGARPVNMFLLLYPNQSIARASATELLWVLLNSHSSLSRLHSVSRTYGGSTLKVEPRELDNLPVINPLALAEDTRQTIKGWIEDFFHHRQVSVLLRQVDALVESLLAATTPAETRPLLPTQLRLLETRADYKA